ncbi:unnamed protein product [Fusarium graminearum]|nr:unnamed protein product [Fusarium graminearum]CAG2002200.1 unnamed protein product [Fusarium graminearum]CAG2002771.1 unnamed protein product [Fusarium graminearum]VTO92132.1 unnamed protein product [Fusarium graminearum]
MRHHQHQLPKLTSFPTKPMDSSLHEVWQAAAGSPFFPTVDKDTQFTLAFALLLVGFFLTGVFALNRTLINVPLLGIPASLTLAVHVQITEEGIRFASDHARVMQGVAFLDKSLFSSYTVNLPSQDGDDAPELPNFQLSLSSVLEVLQIFGAVDVATRAHKAEQDPYRSNLRNYRPDAFSNQTLGISGTCTLLYAEEGDPFKITIEESGVKTTASLTTYLPEIPDDIPFDRTDLTFKIIMQSRTLLDSLAEISPTAPLKLTITATKASPFLSLAGAGDLGSSGVDFARGRDLLETFTIQDRWSQAYKFDFIKNSTEAMRIANKVSLRGDSQGVLSLQFMVDIEGGKRSFLDFRFVPFLQEDGEDDDTDGAE